MGGREQPTRAIAAMTKGQSTLTHLLAVHELFQQTLKKCNGCMPFLPLSPSGWMPFVIL